MTAAHTEADHLALKAHITGRVQGVWFRAWTRDEAAGLGLAGWVRNRRDGSVEAVFAGPRPQVEEMVRRCHHGPPAAVVDRVETTPVAGIDMDFFDIRPTM